MAGCGVFWVEAWDTAPSLTKKQPQILRRAALTQDDNRSVEVCCFPTLAGQPFRLSVEDGAAMLVVIEAS
jgi:hypothetical protein